jgi:threonine synthase
LREQLQAYSVDDATIRQTIASHARGSGQTSDADVFCPHTATAMHLLDHLRDQGDSSTWTVVATAHPAKFESVVEPLLGRPLAVPASLAAMLARPASAEPLAADDDELRHRLLDQVIAY